MNNQEAIDIIKSAVAEVEWEYPMNYAAAFDAAIDALTKVKRMEEGVEAIPYLNITERLIGYKCEACNGKLSSAWEYCAYCGRKVKWHGCYP